MIYKDPEYGRVRRYHKKPSSGFRPTHPDNLLFRDDERDVLIIVFGAQCIQSNNNFTTALGCNQHYPAQDVHSIVSAIRTTRLPRPDTSIASTAPLEGLVLVAGFAI